MSITIFVTNSYGNFFVFFGGRGGGGGGSWSV